MFSDARNNAHLADSLPARIFTTVVSFGIGWGFAALLRLAFNAAAGAALPAWTALFGGVLLAGLYLLSARADRRARRGAATAVPAAAATVAAPAEPELGFVARQALKVATRGLEPVPAEIKALLRGRARIVTHDESGLQVVVTTSGKAGMIAAVNLEGNDPADSAELRRLGQLAKAESAALAAVLVVLDAPSTMPTRTFDNVTVCTRRNVAKALDRLPRQPR